MLYICTLEVNVHWQLGKAALGNLHGCEVGLDSAASNPMLCWPASQPMRWLCLQASHLFCCSFDLIFSQCTQMEMHHRSLETQQRQQCIYFTTGSFLTAVSEGWRAFSKKMSITQISGIHFCQRSLQKPDNDDVVFRCNFDASILHRAGLSLPRWTYMCNYAFRFYCRSTLTSQHTNPDLSAFHIARSDDSR